LFHAFTYWNQGTGRLATWLTNFSATYGYDRSIGFALILAGCHSVFTIAIGILLNREFNTRSINSAINISVGVLILVILLSQAITSSVLRIFYEAGFSAVFISSTIVQKVFLPPAKNDPQNKELYDRLWDLLRLSIPLVLGFSAVFGGVGAISSVSFRQACMKYPAGGAMFG